MKNTSDTISTIIKVTNIVYPKTFSVTEGTWGVISCYDLKSKLSYKINGNLPSITQNDILNTEYYVVLKTSFHEKYGKQYSIVYITINVNLENSKNLKSFLSYVATDLQIEALFNVFDNPLEIIKSKDINKLCTVKGIGKTTALRIINKYEENIIYEEAFVELGQYGFTTNLIKKIVNNYHNLKETLDIVKNNPYKLIQDIEGIGWNKADAIGLKVGIKLEDTKRIEGYIKYYLENQAQEGNSYVSTTDINANIINLYDVKTFNEKKNIIVENFKTAIKNLIEQEFLVFKNNRVYLTKYYQLEKNIALTLKSLLVQNAFPLTHDINDVIDEIEFEKGYRLTEEQINGAKMFINNNVGVITGCAGSGKSTSVDAIIRMFENRQIAQCALAGKAASRLTEITHIKGTTIHKLLGYCEEGGFTYNKDNRLPYDIVILDEASMLGGELFYALVQAIKNGSKLIIVGDSNQLESIGTLNVFKDLIDSNVIPTTKLTQIHRHAQKSGIISDSFNVKNGKQISIGMTDGEIKTKGELQDLVIKINNNNTYQSVVDYFKEEYSKLKDINKIQIILPLKDRGNLSVGFVNKIIQEYYNPRSQLREEDILIYDKGFKSKSNKKNSKNTNTDDEDSLQDNENENIKEFRVGDKVINTTNKDACLVDGDKIRIYNGFLGIVKSVSNKFNEMVIDFNDVGEVLITKDLIPNIELAYAITCHKFQGSETDIVIVGINFSAYTLLCRQWVYTAITRAKKKTILCCNNKALQYAINTNNVSCKHTFLKELLCENDTSNEN